MLQLGGKEGSNFLCSSEFVSLPAAYLGNVTLCFWNLRLKKERVNQSRCLKTFKVSHGLNVTAQYNSWSDNNWEVRDDCGLFLYTVLAHCGPCGVMWK